MVHHTTTMVHHTTTMVHHTRTVTNRSLQTCLASLHSFTVVVTKKSVMDKVKTLEGLHSSVHTKYSRVQGLDPNRALHLFVVFYKNSVEFLQKRK